MALDNIGQSIDGSDLGGDNTTWVMPEAVDNSVQSSPAKPFIQASDLQPIKTIDPNTVGNKRPETIQPIAPSSLGAVPSKPISSPVIQQPDNSLMPEVRHSVVGKLIGAIIFLIILSAIVFVGLVYADDKGLLISGLSAKATNLPLSSMWGGLSAKPQTASSQVNEATNRTNNMHYTGTIKGWGTTNIIDNNLVENDPLMTSGDFSFIAKGSNFLFNYKAIFGDNRLTTEFRNIDGVLYTGLSTVNTADNVLEWEKSKVVTNLGATLFNQQLTNLISKSTFVAREKLNSGDTYHYRTPIGTSDLSSIADFPSLSNWKDALGTADLWVSRKSHIIQKITLTLALAGTTPKSFLLEANVNSSVEEIEVPSVFASDSTNSTDTTTKTSDTVRKQDIQKMATALNKYFTDRSSYPISAVIENTSDTKSVIRGALVPLYIDTIPTDPVGVHYYGYKSDGKSYELTAVLDDTSDSEGMQVGAVFLYKITNLSTPAANPSASSTN